MKTYNFGGYFITTEEILEGYISIFEVTPEETFLIESGANIEVVDGVLNIENPAE